MSRKTSIYFELPLLLPIDYVKRYRAKYEELYGTQGNICDGEILRLGLRHWGKAGIFQPSFFNLQVMPEEQEYYSLVLTPEEWRSIFGEELLPSSPKEELLAVFWSYFDSSYNGMGNILDAEKKSFRLYDSFLENADEETGFQLLQGLKQMLLHDGGVLVECELYSFKYVDASQCIWKVSYDRSRRCVRRYRSFL